jgi:hypothetical protein
MASSAFKRRWTTASDRADGIPLGFTAGITYVHLCSCVFSNTEELIWNCGITVFFCYLWRWSGTESIISAPINVKGEECHLLGYKNPVRTSQETHHVSATESSQLMLCKIWGFHGCSNEECRLLVYKFPVRTSQETHYISITDPRRLMLCKIWGFHDGDYEERRLLGYRDPARTSQEPHYVSATEPSQLMLCKIWGFHGGDYE